MIIFLALTLAAVASAQSSVTLYFNASSTTVDSGAVASIFNNFEVDSIVSFANSLPNQNGMDNSELAHLRAMAVLDVADSMNVLYACKVRSTVVAGSDAGNRKVIIYISPKPNSPLAEAVEKSMERMNAVQRMTWAANNADDFYDEWESQHDIEHSEVRAAPVESIRLWRVNVAPDSAHVSSLASKAPVLDRQAPANLYILHKKDSLIHLNRETFVRLAANHIDRQQARDTAWMNSKRLRRKMRHAFKMWVKYDAIPSHKMGREGAVLPNGGSYQQATLWTPAGRKLKRHVVWTWGNDIPFLGWDERAYAEYYSDFTVFGEVVKNSVVETGLNPYAYSVVLYDQQKKDKANAKRLRKEARRDRWLKFKDKCEKGWDKVQYALRKPVACFKAALKLQGKR